MASTQAAWHSSEVFEFHVAAIASFLESAIDHYVDNLGLQFAEDESFVSWLKDTWLIEERRHGERLRRYVESRWPAFAWPAAWAEYRQSIPSHTTGHLNPSRALEMLSRCVTETEAAMMYRCIASFAVDAPLRVLSRELSSDEVGHYRVFRGRFAAALRRERVGTVAAIHTVLGRTRLTIDRDVALAFGVLRRHWSMPPPFPSMTYQGFLTDVRAAVAGYFPVEAAERMLWKPLEHLGRRRRLVRPLLRQAMSRRILSVLQAH
jgi:rubrerythrin